MAREYFSQRHRPSTPRSLTFDDALWATVLRPYLRDLAAQGKLIMAFPDACPDGAGPCGVNDATLRARMLMVLGHGEWPLPLEVADEDEAFDYLEFFYDHISTPQWGAFHSYFQHTHVLGSDQEEAQDKFREDLNAAFARLGYRYDFTVDGQVVLLTDELQDHEIISESRDTTDRHLSELLSRAAQDFFDRSGNRKVQALEAIVDAFERTKTLEDPNKIVSIQLTLAKITDQPEIQARLDAEMRELTDIGNSFEIRHHEVVQIPIHASEVSDYLFYRYYNLVRIIVAHYPAA